VTEESSSDSLSVEVFDGYDENGRDRNISLSLSATPFTWELGTYRAINNIRVYWIKKLYICL